MVVSTRKHVIRRCATFGHLTAALWGKCCCEACLVPVGTEALGEVGERWDTGSGRWLPQHPCGSHPAFVLHALPVPAPRLEAGEAGQGPRSALGTLSIAH